RFRIHGVELLEAFRANPNFTSFPPPCVLRTVCTGHCSKCADLAVRAILSCRRPHLPPRFTGQSEQSAQASRLGGNSSQGLRSLRDLTQHLTTRADDSHAAPVQILPFGSHWLSPA